MGIGVCVTSAYRECTTASRTVAIDAWWWTPTAKTIFKSLGSAPNVMRDILLMLPINWSASYPNLRISIAKCSPHPETHAFSATLGSITQPNRNYVCLLIHFVRLQIAQMESVCHVGVAMHLHMAGVSSIPMNPPLLHLLLPLR